MIRQSTATGRTCCTSSIQREVIQAHGHSGSNQNCTSSRDCDCSVITAPTPAVMPLFLVTPPDAGVPDLKFARAFSGGSAAPCEGLTAATEKPGPVSGKEIASGKKIVVYADIFTTYEILTG